MKGIDAMDKVLGEKAKQAPASGAPATEPAATGADVKVETVTHAIDDAAVLAYLKGKGKEFTSLDELSVAKPAAAAPKELTKEEKEALAKEKKDKALVYGFQTGKVKAEELSAYAIAKNADPVQYAFDKFKTEALADNAELTEDEIRDQFDEENFLNLEADDKKRMRAEQRMIKDKESDLKKNFGHIETLDSDYELHETEEVSRNEYNTRIPAIVATVPKEIKFATKYIGEDTKEKEFSFNFKIPDETINELRDKYMTDGYFKAFKSGALNDEKIAETILTEAKLKHFDQILAESQEAFHAQKLEGVKMGRLGVVPVREGGGSGGMVLGSTQGLQVMDKILKTKK